MKYAKAKPDAGKKKSALEKARSTLKKTEGAHTPSSIKRKLNVKKKARTK